MAKIEQTRVQFPPPPPLDKVLSLLDDFMCKKEIKKKAKIGTETVDVIIDSLMSSKQIIETGTGSPRSPRKYKRIDAVETHTYQ